MVNQAWYTIQKDDAKLLIFCQSANNFEGKSLQEQKCDNNRLITNYLALSASFFFGNLIFFSEYLELKREKSTFPEIPF